jgi:hypothetical protein
MMIYEIGLGAGRVVSGCVLIQRSDDEEGEEKTEEEAQGKGGGEGGRGIWLTKAANNGRPPALSRWVILEKEA